VSVFLLLRRSLRHFWRTNLAIALGVATAVAVLSGALIVGDSVRASLRDLFLRRVGAADLVISSTGFFREALGDEIQRLPAFSTRFTSIAPLVALDGFVTHPESGRRAGSVLVYGVDERFWRFHGVSVAPPEERDALLSASLAEELGAAVSDAVLVRVRRPSDAVPAGSLYGRKDDVGRTVRLTVRDVLDAARLGEFALTPQQGPVRAIFVPLRRLQRDLDQPGQVNGLLVAAAPGHDDAADELARLGRETYRLEDVGLRIRALPGGQVGAPTRPSAETTGAVSRPAALSFESTTALITDRQEEVANRTAARLGYAVRPIFTYLANAIRGNGRTIPYSLVTGIDLRAIGVEVPDSSAGSPAPIVLNTWAARDLDVAPGDRIDLDYYVWEEAGRLATRTAQFTLAAVTPTNGLAADRDLAPEYPGISGAGSLSDWDPPFPIDLSRIRRQDEDYWDEYRTTPKAFVPLEVGQRLWESRYGRLTSVRFLREADGVADPEPLAEALRSELDPLDLGFAVSAVRARGLEASRGATDFGEYFTYFSFFLVFSALLLGTLFFRLGVEQRVREIGILRAVGVPPKLVRRLFLLEGLLLALVGAAAGMAGAVAYGALMMTGLRTWWVDAVGTRLLDLHVTPLSLILGAAAGLVVATACIAWTLAGLGRPSPRLLLSGALGPAREPGGAARRRWTLMLDTIAVVAAAALLAAAIAGTVDEAVAFFGAGGLLLVAALAFFWRWLSRRDARPVGGTGWWAIARLGFRNATVRPGRSVLSAALIAFATFIIVAVDAFRGEDPSALADRASGTGGYALVAGSLLPVFHDPNGAEGRDALNLPPLEDAALRSVRFARFRVHAGEDASCLNLYAPRKPTIVAPAADFDRAGRFTFQDSLADTPEERADPWRLLDRQRDEGAVPIVGDANSMTYVLHLAVGDTFQIDRGDGEPVTLQLVGTLQRSIFQSQLIMSEANFLRLFPSDEGYRFFLIDAPPERSAEVAAVLEDRLADSGFDATSAAERLAVYHRVEHAYLSTFQMLGGLGLVLGTIGLATVLLRNVLERRRELALLRAIGYTSRDLRLIVVAENLLLLAAGVGIGVGTALVAILPALLERGVHVPATPLGLLGAVILTGLTASVLATRAALGSDLVPALRAE
jgi:ABC-type antimicrobial peptide transport system permease subunit